MNFKLANLCTCMMQYTILYRRPYPSYIFQTPLFIAIILGNDMRGGAGVNHVKRDWLEIFNVNCDLYIFFCVKRDWGYLRET